MDKQKLSSTRTFSLEGLDEMSDESLITYMNLFGFEFHGFEKENRPIKEGYEKIILRGWCFIKKNKIPIQAFCKNCATRTALCLL